MAVHAPWHTYTEEGAVQSAPVNSTTGNSTIPFSLTISTGLKSTPKFDTLPNLTENLHVFLVELTGADCISVWSQSENTRLFHLYSVDASTNNYINPSLLKVTIRRRGE